MGNSSVHFYRYIDDEKEAAAMPRRFWQLVLENGARDSRLLTGYELLQSFEGAWVYADAILCQLREVKRPPAWSLIAWPNNWMWFSLGRYVSLYLPIADPPT